MKAVGDYVLIQLADSVTKSGIRLTGFNQATVFSVGDTVPLTLREGDCVAFTGEPQTVINDTLSLHFTDIVAVITNGQ